MGTETNGERSEREERETERKLFHVNAWRH